MKNGYYVITTENAFPRFVSMQYAYAKLFAGLVCRRSESGTVIKIILYQNNCPICTAYAIRKK